MLGYEELLTDYCVYEKYTGVNKYNEKTYNDPINIKCFSISEINNERRSDSQEVNNHQKIFISNKITPNKYDKINGKEIKSIKEIKGLITSAVGWEIII